MHQNQLGVGFVQLERAFLRDASLSGDAKLLGVVLAAFANSARLAWPGTRLLRRLTGMGWNRLWTARAELVRRGYIGVAQRRKERGRFARAEYEVSGLLLHRRNAAKPGTERA